MQEMTLTDAEYQLIHALQIWPRAPWAVLASALNADAVTLARRWSGLNERGMAWVTVQAPWPQTAMGAVVELECAAGSIETVCSLLVGHPECLAVELTSGGRDLLLTIACADAAAFSRYVVGTLGHITGVRSVRTHPIISTVSTASDWRLRTLDSAQVRAIEAARDSSAAQLRSGFSRRPIADPSVVTLLAADGRATTAMVADGLGLPARRARDRLNTTLASKDVTLRTDMPRWASDWPVCAWYFIRVPAAQVASVGENLRGLREVRTVLAVAGPANLLVSVWLRALEDVGQLEVLLEQKLPDLSILDRCLVFGVRKRMGRTFDEDERALPGMPLSASPLGTPPG